MKTSLSDLQWRPLLKAFETSRESIELSESPKNKTDFKTVGRIAEGPWDKIS